CFADEGARVAVLARTQRDLDDVVEDLGRRGSPDPVGCPVDVRDEAQVNEVFADLATRWGELNVLVNAVGPDVRGSVADLTDAQWRVAFEDGVLGIVHCVRSSLELLRKAEWARIVNFSASSTQRQTVSLAAYTAAKSMVTSIS
ncbi:SDR family oxidoreductase, partial [Streptomyces sp. SID10244]|nr:SDR family oxidoreductase [Streptomyces sp. SID10244]